MPLPGIEQPQALPLGEGLRLGRYDGHYEKALPGYQDPYVYQNSEGIFDKDKVPDLDYVRGMCGYLDSHGELYFIEALENGVWVAVGDVTVKPENPPIAIWYAAYRGRGIGRLAMQAVIARLRQLGCKRITGSTVYKWNQVSLKMHQKLGFQIVQETEQEYYLELDL